MKSDIKIFSANVYETSTNFDPKTGDGGAEAVRGPCATDGASGAAAGRFWKILTLAPLPVAAADNAAKNVSRRMGGGPECRLRKIVYNPKKSTLGPCNEPRPEPRHEFFG